MEFFNLVKNDDSKLQDVLNYFNDEYLSGKEEIKITGGMMDNISAISSQYEARYSQLQELEAILTHYENKLAGLKGSIYKDLQEHSKRQLTSSDIRQYVDSDNRVLAMLMIINEITLVKNKFISLSKGFEVKQYMLSNLTKLQIEGLLNVQI